MLQHRRARRVESECDVADADVPVTAVRTRALGDPEPEPPGRRGCRFLRSLPRSPEPLLVVGASAAPACGNPADRSARGATRAGRSGAPGDGCDGRGAAVRRPFAYGTYLVRVEAALGELDEHEVGDDHAERIRKNASGSAVKPSRWASGENGRTAPRTRTSDRERRSSAGSAGCGGTGPAGCGSRRPRASGWRATRRTSRCGTRRGWRAGSEHDEERGEVEDRADRAEHGHEAANEGDVPGRRPGHDLRSTRCRSGWPVGRRRRAGC